MGKNGADKELEAMTALSKAMSPFGDDDRPTVDRILTWFNSKYGLTPRTTTGKPGAPGGGGADDGGQGAQRQFSTAADLYDAVEPEDEFEKAITVGYWLQVCNSQQDFTGMDVNGTLKHMGHGIANITEAFNTAKDRKPALVMQTQKSGSTRQARKMYRLTVAGLRWVESRLNGPSATNE